MNTPILTKHQQKHTLSAKKTPAKGLRNVLAQPQDSFWPTVNFEKLPVLENLLKKLVSIIKRPSCTLPWSQLKHMKKEERAQAKKEALSKEGNVSNTEIINSVILGINAVTRSLEKNNVCCVLMEAKIDPPFLVKHIILMAQNKNIPILLLPNLKTITLNTIGFASAACAFKIIVKESPSHHFYPLYTTICDIFKDTPLPKNSLQSLTNTKALEQPVLCKIDDRSTECKVQSDSEEKPKFTLSTSVYKYRSSRKERVFIPPSIVANPIEKPITENKLEPMEGNDFISIKFDDFDGPDLSKSEPVKYLPLRVKRLQGNANRVKATKFSKQKQKYKG